ncbi:hypothetical protein [Nonlabens dokdonensis]|nr:hypothetical protein [Nonlabens dokdonensis]
MLKKVFVVAIAAMFTLGTVSCREESTGEKIEDAVDSAADDVEDAVD